MHIYVRSIGTSRKYTGGEYRCTGTIGETHMCVSLYIYIYSVTQFQTYILHTHACTHSCVPIHTYTYAHSGSKMLLHDFRHRCIHAYYYNNS